MIHSFGHHISIIYRSLHIWINSRLEPLGIGSGQFIFLNHISRNEGISQKELSRNVMVDKATAAKAVRKLAEMGYVESRINEEDKRIHNLFITPKGKDVIPGIRSVLTETSEILTKEMTEVEKENAAEILEKMLANISDHVGRQN